MKTDSGEEDLFCFENARICLKMTVNTQPSQSVIFNKKALVLKIDKYNIDASPPHDGIIEKLAKVQRGSDKWLGNEFAILISSTFISWNQKHPCEGQEISSKC